MTQNGKTLQDYRDAYIKLAEKARRIGQLQEKLMQDWDQLLVQIELATESLKSLQQTTGSRRPYWLVLAALLGGLVGGPLAAMIAVLTGV